VADLRPALGGDLLGAAGDLAEEAAFVAVRDQLLDLDAFDHRRSPALVSRL
jgi:hypothetical protein